MKKLLFTLQNLLGHPLCMALVRNKWNKFGRYVYLSNLLTYIAFLIALSDYCILSPAPYSARNIVESSKNETFFKNRYDI